MDRETRAEMGGGTDAPVPKTLLTIGQMARLNGVSEKALRIYQAKGILVPAHTDPETGYRHYSLSQCATLDMVQQLQIVGFSLDQIAETLAQEDVGSLQGRLNERMAEIEERMRDLAIARQVAHDLRRSCGAYLHKPPLGQFMLETLPERRALEFPLEHSAPADVGRSGTDAMEAWELDLRHVKREIVERGWPLSLFRTVGCTIAREDLVAGRILYRSAFVFVSPAFGDDIYGQATPVPAGTHLVEYIDGVLTDDGRERETVELARMLAECERRGLEPAGDYRGEVIADGPAFLYRGREMLFRMCLPVRLQGQPVWEEEAGA